MKKRVFSFLVCAVMIITSTAVTAFADNQNPIDAYDGQIVPEDPVDLFIETLDKDLQAGTYMDENGNFCLAVTDVEKAQSLIDKANLPSKINLDKVEYSMEELEAARDNLFVNSEDFDIQIVAVDASKNCLAVFTTDYTENNQNEVTESVSSYVEETYKTPLARGTSKKEIDVIFYDNNAPISSEIAAENEAAAVTPRALSTIKSGVYMWHGASTGAESSVGWRLKVNGVTGYTTCGHNWAKNNPVYYDGNSLGTVSLNYFSTTSNTDVSFVPSNIAFYGMRNDGKKITAAGAPVQGSTIIFDGARHYQNGLGRATAKITATNGVANMTDTLNRTAKLTNIIVFGTQPIPGDSGCAIIEDRGDGTVRLVGFNSHQQKGPNDAANVYSYGGAVTWASVRDAMGGSSVVSVMN